MISTHQRMKRYCSEPLENIENYDKAVADTEHVWDCHHRAEILPCGRYTAAQLKKHGLYWHRPASELIFLRHDVHRSLHHTGNKNSCGKKLSDETKRKIAEKMMGKPAWNRGKHLSEEHRRKIAESLKGHTVTSDTRRKMSASQTNRHDMSIPVEMTRISDGFTKVFASQKEAARWLKENGYPKADRAHIYGALKKNQHSCGAKWRFVDD